MVIGGKSAEQNESLLKKITSSKEEKIIMHTSEPGSPFTIILSNKKPSSSDIKECAIFTASFSRAWRQVKKKANVDIFSSTQLFKTNSMKPGTWGVKSKIKSISAHLSLVLAKQKGKLRAIPESSASSKNSILLKISPGKIDKIKILPQLQELLPKISKEEILSALPSGGIKIEK